MVPENINTTYHKRFLKILRREGEDLKGREVFQKKFPFIKDSIYIFWEVNNIQHWQLMSIFKALIVSTFTWKTLSYLFHHTWWDWDSDFPTQLLVNPICVLPVGNISVGTNKERQKKSSQCNAEITSNWTLIMIRKDHKGREYYILGRIMLGWCHYTCT